MKSKYPDHLELEYRKLITNAVSRLGVYLIPRIRRKIKNPSEVIVDQDFLQFLNDLMASVRERLFTSGYIAEKLLSILGGVQGHATRTMINTLKSKKKLVANYDLTVDTIKQFMESDVARNFIAGFAERNLELVRIAGNEYIDGIYKIAEQGYLKGESLKTMTASMREFTGGEISKAEFWARDQIGDAYSEYTHQAHNVAGVTRYRWITVGDNKVRDSHAELNGKVFTWAQGAPGLSKPGARHPGEDYRCRCYAEPILPGENE